MKFCTEILINFMKVMLSMKIPKEVANLFSGSESVDTVFNDLELWDNDYDVYVTNKRIIFYREEGFVFKSKRTYAIKFSQIEDVWYKEKGLLRKTGILVIKARGKKWVVKGPPNKVNELYKILEEYS